METWWCGGDGVCLVKQPSPSEAPAMAAGDSLLPGSEEADLHQALCSGRQGALGTASPRDDSRMYPVPSSPATHHPLPSCHPPPPPPLTHESAASPWRPRDLSLLQAQRFVGPLSFP